MATHMDSFRAAITAIRNVLRRHSISDMNSMRTVGIYFTARYIDQSMATKLGIDPKLSWESLYQLCETGKMDESLELFKDKLLPSLDTKLSIYKFAFDLTNAHSHREIMNTINELNIKEIEAITDILGLIYEIHLESGSGNSRDLGQFFTDRNVCKFMVDLVEPKLKRKGVPESMCDPTMGTGGFLNMYVAKLKQHKIDWTVQHHQIHGCDTDERVVGLANINLFLETQTLFTNLVKRDSIQLGLPMTQYDIILANPPFGIDGITNKNAHTSIQTMRLPGDHSEPVFLQLMMAHLAPGGRCAAIFPNGFFQNKYADHVATRKHLVENFKVKKVIRFNSNVSKGPKRGSVKQAKFFVGTGVQCSILLFENSVKEKTTDIEFYDMKKTETGLEEPVLIRTVSRQHLDSAFSLDVSKYMDTDVDPSVPTLEALCNYENGRTIKGGNPNMGTYPIMGGGTTYNGLNTEYNREPNTISISKSGTAGHVHWHTQRFWAGDCFTIETKNPDVLDNRYLYYYLDTHPELILSRRTGSTVPHCKWEDIRKLPVVVPPIEVQRKVVEEMDHLYQKKKEEEEFLRMFGTLSKRKFDECV